MSDPTRSTDPKMVAARVFIGRLPTEKIEKKEIEDIFAKFGKILGIALFKGFGFVQYETEMEARAAVSGCSGTLFKGTRIDCHMASERRRPQGSEPMAPVQQNGAKRPGEMDMGPPPRRQNFDMQHSAGRSEPFPAPATHQQPQIRPRDAGTDRPFDCVIVVCQKNSRSYAEYIERRLLELNLTIDMIFLIHEGALEKAIDDMTKRGVLYIITVMPTHEQHRSVTVSIVHGVPQEHRNMPLEDALVMLARNFNAYVSNLRVGSEQPSMGFLLNLLADGKHLSIAELERIIGHLQERRDRLIEAEGGKAPPRLPLSQPQTGAGNATNPLASLGLAGGGVGGLAGAGSLAASMANPNQDLQQKILSLISGGAGPLGASQVQQQQQSGATTALSSLAQQYGITLNQGGAGAGGGGLLQNKPGGAGAGLLQTPNQPPLNLGGLGGGAGGGLTLENLGQALGAVSNLNNVNPNLRKALDTLVSNPNLLRGMPAAQAQSLSSLASGVGGPPGNVADGLLQQQAAAAQFSKGPQQQQQPPSLLGSLNSFMSSQQQQQQMPPVSQQMGFGGGQAMGGSLQPLKPQQHQQFGGPQQQMQNPGQAQQPPQMQFGGGNQMNAAFNIPGGAQNQGGMPGGFGGPGQQQQAQMQRRY